MTAIAFESALVALALRLVAHVRDGETITLSAEQATAVATAILERAHMLWPESLGGEEWHVLSAMDLELAREKSASLERAQQARIEGENLANLGALGRDYPALDRWRRLVLGERKGRQPLERAAAWELQALSLDVAGDPYLAHRARLAAAHVLAPTSSSKPTRAA